MKPGQTMWHEVYVDDDTGQLTKSKGFCHYCVRCQSEVIAQYFTTAPYCLRCFYVNGGKVKGKGKPWYSRAIELLKQYPSERGFKPDGWSVFAKIDIMGMFLPILKCGSLNLTPKTTLTLQDYFSAGWLEAYRQRFEKHTVSDLKGLTDGSRN